jgi:hypothetical protein
MAKKPWRLAKALEQLRSQVNAMAPKRSKKMDGSIGDAAHSARKSDHNPNAAGVVCAIDVTHDPAGGLDGEKFANALRASADPRINYVIFNRRIAGAGKGWDWRRYTGAAPHDKHVHISVKQDARLYDDASPWKAGAEPKSAPAKPKPELLPVPPKVDVNRPLTEVERRQAQDRLRELDYTSVGETNGVWGKSSKGALTEFCDVNDLDYKDPPTIALLWAMQSPTAKRAPNPPTRSPTTVEEIAPEVKTAKEGGFLATLDGYFKIAVAAIASGLGFVVENKETFAALGVGVGVLLLAGLAFNYYQKRKAAQIVQTATAAVQEGDRFRSAGQ